MPKMTQLTLSLASKPGVLAQVTSALARAGVNIMAICAAESSGARGKIRILVDNPARAIEALKAARVRAGQEDVLTVTLDDRPGTLAEVAEKLARARVNVKCAYATTGGGSALVVLTVSNVPKAQAALTG
ncbi:MAG: ACT domain-containing protein [Candidatus Rokuibacteriota bacterium]